MTTVGTVDGVDTSRGDKNLVRDSVVPVNPSNGRERREGAGSGVLRKTVGALVCSTTTEELAAAPYMLVCNFSAPSSWRGEGCDMELRNDRGG